MEIKDRETLFVAGQNSQVGTVYLVVNEGEDGDSVIRNFIQITVQDVVFGIILIVCVTIWQAMEWPMW